VAKYQISKNASQVKLAHFNLGCRPHFSSWRPKRRRMGLDPSFFGFLGDFMMKLSVSFHQKGQLRSKLDQNCGQKHLSQKSWRFSIFRKIKTHYALCF